MDMTLSAAVGYLVLVFTAAVALGLLIQRIEVRRGEIANRNKPGVSEGIGGAVGFLGGASAFLLGVLMLASVDHYNATRDTVDSEALAYSSAFDSTARSWPAGSLR